MSVTIDGAAEVKEILGTIAPNHARNILRATVQRLATELAKEITTNAPAGHTGNVKENIRGKRRRGKPDLVVSEVHIAERESEKSLFYWRFVEHGTVEQEAKPFVRPAFDKAVANIEPLFLEAFGRQLERALKRQANKIAKAGGA